MKSTKKTSASRSVTADPAGTVLEDTGLGEVKIHENVISMLVRKAALGVEGVSRLAGSQLVDIIAEAVGSRRMQDRAISVDLRDSGKVSIDIKLNIHFGFKIPDVSADVQKAVIAEVENTTGMTVAKVNVSVQEMEDARDGEPEDADETGFSAVPPPR